MAGNLSRYAAANARVRALLADLLGRSGLETLYTYPSPLAMFDALLRTSYSRVLAAGPEHSGCLLGRLAGVGRTLLGELRGTERDFVRLYLLRWEVENLKVLIRAVHSQRPWEQVAPHIAALPEIATLDPEVLAHARDLRDLVDRLADTAYGPAARSAVHRLPEAGPYALEIAIELDYYDRLWLATAALKPADRVRARRLLGILFDILNLTAISGYRDALGLTPEEIVNYTLSQGHWLTVDIRRSLAEDPARPWEVALARTPYASILVDVPARGFDALVPGLWRFLAAEAQRALVGYPFHIGVPLALLVAQEIEIRDLQSLLAAKSIGVPTAEALNYVVSVRH